MIILAQLSPVAAYAVLVDPATRVDLVLHGSRLQRRWHDAKILKMPPGDPPPPGYVRVECDEPGQYIAVWRDPSRPELAEPQPGEALPAPIRDAAQAAAPKHKRVEAFEKAEDIRAETPETLDDALIRAGEALVGTLGLAAPGP